jgi:hypothetical protein
MATDAEDSPLGPIWHRLSAPFAVHAPQSALCRNRLARPGAHLYIGAIGKATPRLRTRRTKMTKTSGLISDNTLFSVLIAAFLGWAALTIATGPSVTSPAASSDVARIAPANTNL